MDYNSQRELLLISEYGRNIRNMVTYGVTIEDRTQGTGCTSYCYWVMASLNPQVRELVDYKHKLWDHLFILSDFQLDVDSPFLFLQKMLWRLNRDNCNIQVVILNSSTRESNGSDDSEKLLKWKTAPEKIRLLPKSGKFHEDVLSDLNKDTVDDSTILKHLDDLSKGNLRLHESAKLNHTAEI